MIVGTVVKESPCRPDNNQKEDPFVAQLERVFVACGFLPQRTAEVAAALKMDRKKFKEAHNDLRRSGRLIRIHADIFIHKSHIDHLINVLSDFFSRKDILTPQDLRDMFGLSRKYSIPLLEYLDSIKFTVRVAEGRKLCRGKDFINYGVQ